MSVIQNEVVYYVMPVADRWVVRAVGRAGATYDRLEDALVAAEALVVRGARVRRLTRAEPTRDGPREVASSMTS